MPLNPQRPDETREMRLVGKVVELADAVGDRSLPEFIARRRQPGAGWRTWDELSFELAEITGEIVSDRTLQLWAKRYGIPENTTADGTKAIKGYLAALAKADIVITTTG